MKDMSFKDLETRGFVLIPAFLSAAEVRQCREDFEQQPVDAGNRNYGLSTASEAANERMKDRVQGVLDLVNRQTDLRVDLPLGAAYFATGRGIKFTWHQDHESYFCVQNHYDYLNFYIPILKPRKDKSNLSVIPFDVLEWHAPRMYRKLVRGGASRFYPMVKKRVTLVMLDDRGSRHLMRGDIGRLAHTPHLDPGDLLLLRGDMIHQTQDTETERVSLSFRVANSQTLVHRSKLVHGSLNKLAMMLKHKAMYERMFQAFDDAGADALPLGQMEDALRVMTIAKPMRIREFLRYLVRQKLHLGVPRRPPQVASA